MTITDIILVSAGGFIGAIIRFFLSKKFNVQNGFPLGTFIVNLVGSFFIGVIFGLTLPKVWTLFLVSGLLGALTTFSTLQKEIIERKEGAIVYAMLTYGGGIILAVVGYMISS